MHGSRITTIIDHMMHLEVYHQGYTEKNKTSLMGFFSLRLRLRYNQPISNKRKNYTFNKYSKWGAFTRICEPSALAIFKMDSSLAVLV